MDNISREAAIEAVLNIRHAAAGDFAPEFSGKQGEAYDRAVLDVHKALSALPAVDGQAREWFHVVIMDGKTYGIKDWGGSMSFPWSEDRQDAWELKDAINKAVDFSFKHSTLVEPSQGHIPPPLPAPPIE